MVCVDFPAWAAYKQVGHAVPVQIHESRIEIRFALSDEVRACANNSKISLRNYIFRVTSCHLECTYRGVKMLYVNRCRTSNGYAHLRARVRTVVDYRSIKRRPMFDLRYVC